MKEEWKLSLVNQVQFKSMLFLPQLTFNFLNPRTEASEARSPQ